MTSLYLPEALAREIIESHAQRPRGKGEQAGAKHVKLSNPACGDVVEVWLSDKGKNGLSLSFTGKGCAISQASASLMVSALSGKTRAEAEQLAQAFGALVGQAGPPPPSSLPLGDLMALAGVGRLHTRRKCALLAWQALGAALQESGQ